jgi:hypothetical protein
LSSKVNSDGGEPLPGISVLLEGTNTGTVTNFDGEYQINVPFPDANLIFSFIRYQSKRLTVGSQSMLNVTLEEDLNQLGEVVVTAFGVQQEKKSLGYSVEEIRIFLGEIPDATPIASRSRTESSELIPAKSQLTKSN